MLNYTVFQLSCVAIFEVTQCVFSYLLSGDNNLVSLHLWGIKTVLKREKVYKCFIQDYYVTTKPVKMSKKARAYEERMKSLWCFFAKKNILLHFRCLAGFWTRLWITSLIRISYMFYMSEFPLPMISRLGSNSWFYRQEIYLENLSVRAVL